MVGSIWKCEAKTYLALVGQFSVSPIEFSLDWGLFNTKNIITRGLSIIQLRGPLGSEERYEISQDITCNYFFIEYSISNQKKKQQTHVT